jgi:putative transcriptional regulator
MSNITIRTTVDAPMVDTAAVDAGPQVLEQVPEEEPKERTKVRPGPRVKTLRRALGLTQEEFAARYGIPLGTLRDWEQGRTEPDQPARAYIRVIASNPEWVSRALAAESQ